MRSSRSNPKVDSFFSKAEKWQKEFRKLREIILDHELTEELKWGKPFYRFQKNNIVLMHGFKEYCALLFFKGALLKDPRGILIQQTENVQAARQVRFNIPEEFQKALNESPALKTAFAALTPGRQRGYLLYFSAPKQSKTRESRIEKCLQPILHGKGLND